MQDVIPVLVPHETVNDESVKLTAWLVASGEKVKAEQLVAQVETSKALLDIHAPVDGFVRYEHEIGCEISVGAPICYITSASDTPLPQGAFHLVVTTAQPSAMPAALPRAAADHKSAADAAAWKPGTFSPRFTRSAAQLLREHALDPQQLSHLPMVKAEDVLALLERSGGHSVRAAESMLSGDAAESMLAAGVPVRWEALSRRKLGEIRYLRWAQSNTVASSVTVACPTYGLRSLLRTAGGAVSAPAPIVVFEAARLLRKYRALNAVCVGGRVGYYDEVNIGVAMDYDKGLMVPVVRNADHKDPAAIAEELWKMMYKYMRQGLTADDLGGGTFVVSDLSAEGVTSFVPLINQGQSAILGIGSEMFPVAGAAGSFNLILTFDHQVAEGRMAARFLNDLAERVQAHESSLRNKLGSDTGPEK